MIEPIGNMGGMHYYTNSILSELLNSQIDIKLSTSKHSKNDFNNETNIIFPFGNIFRSKSKLQNLFFLLKGSIKSLIVSILEKREIIHLHFFGFKFHFLIIFILFYFFRKKIVLTIHDVDQIASSKKKLFLWLSMFMFRLSKACIVHNNYSKKIFNNLSQRKLKKIYVIRHGNYDNYVQRMKNNNDALFKDKFLFHSNFVHILFFGKIKKNKGLDILIDAYKEFVDIETNNKKFKLLIVGRIDDMSLYKKLQKKLLEKSKYNIVTDFTFVSEYKLDYYFRNSDLIVLPYKEIYQSGVFLLSIAYKKPIIASNLEPFKEVLADKNTKNISFFKLNDKKDLVRKFRLFSGNFKKNHNLQFNLDSTYDWDYIASETIDIYRSI